MIDTESELDRQDTFGDISTFWFILRKQCPSCLQAELAAKGLTLKIVTNPMLPTVC